MIMLNNDEIAEVTKGIWINKIKEIAIQEVAFRLVDIKEGVFYFPSNTDEWIESSEQVLGYIQKAFDKGAAAIALPTKTKIKISYPTLLVEDLRNSFRNIALENSEKASAIKILITGSFGKTGCKYQLYSLIHKYKNTLSFLGSGNESLPIYQSLASINKENEVAIIEVAAPGYDVAKKRSKYVNPNIAVITNIGPEHLRQHGGSIENVIENKSRVAYGLKNDGLIIIPDQPEYQTKENMREYINKINPSLKILTFGANKENDAYILDKNFTGLGWKLKISINNKKLSFSLPFLEEHSVRAMLPILLVCDELKLNLNQILKENQTHNHYKSSGNFYKIQFKNKSFYLYDQSIRGILNGFKETLKVISRIKPTGDGKKIALFSEFVNLEESKVDVVDTSEFKDLFKISGLDSLYTTNKFCEHINVLDDKSIWKEHKANIDDIIDIIIGDLKENDYLFVRATLKSKANKLTEKILRKAVKIKQYY